MIEFIIGIFIGAVGVILTAYIVSTIYSIKSNNQLFKEK